MQIVIDIPKEVKESIENGSFGAKYNIYDLCGFIMNGTPLPKNHGRLIDVEWYKEHLYQCEMNGRPLHLLDLHEVLQTVDDAPTVLDAESEE